MQGKAVRIDLVLTFLTWSLVTAYLLHPSVNSQFLTQGSILTDGTFLLALLIFLVAVIVNKTREQISYYALIWQSLALTAILCLEPNSLTLVFGVILMGQLGSRLPLNLGLCVAAFPPLLHLYCSDAEMALLNAGLFYAFNCFAFMVSRQKELERQAKNQQSGLLRELKATQALLSETVRREERLKISRDLHDSLGNHLTALNFQLEIASNSACPMASINKAKNITQLALKDVRQSVSHFRIKGNIDIEDALQQLVQPYNGLAINLKLQTSMAISDTRIAETILRLTQESLTNTLRHSQASHCDITLSSQTDSLQLTISDNGIGCSSLVEGHGIKGMRERVQSVAGSMCYANQDRGFAICFDIPVEQSLS